MNLASLSILGLFALGSVCFLIFSYLMSGLEQRNEQISALKTELKLKELSLSSLENVLEKQNSLVQKLKDKEESTQKELENLNALLDSKSKAINTEVKSCTDQLKETKKALDLYYE